MNQKKAISCSLLNLKLYEFAIVFSVVSDSNENEPLKNVEFLSFENSQIKKYLGTIFSRKVICQDKYIEEHVRS